MAYDLEFEKPLAELERKISGLQRRGDRLKPDEHRQLQEAERELHRRTEEIYFLGNSASGSSQGSPACIRLHSPDI